ncbi:MAG: hypothetical protein QOC95_524 [Thermoleophilaceae bacterium]|nr:hypothetical protein [Thermoleophilaceae bacterium]
MNIRTRQVALAAATSLASAGIVAPQAIAAPTKVNGGRTTLTLTAKSKKALKRHHIKVAARKPGSAKGRSYLLPVKAGSFDFGTNRGTVSQGGSLRLKHGRHAVTVSGLKLTLGKKSSKVVAKIGGRSVTLASLSRRTQKVKSSAANRSVGNLRFRLSARAAKRIDGKLHMRGFSVRKAVGSVSVRVHRPAGAGGTVTPPVAGQTGSVAKIGFAPGVAQALAEAGLSPSALPGGVQLPDGSFSLPVTGANIDPSTGSGTVDLAGGLTLGSGSNMVTLDHPQLVFGGTEQGLYAAVNGVRVKLAGLDKAGLSEALKSGTKQLSDLLVTLSPQGAAALNQAGGVSLFLPGSPFGDLSVTLPSS